MTSSFHAESLQLCVIGALSCSDSNAAVKQTAALCLLKLLRVDPKLIPTDRYSSMIIKLLNNKHLVSILW